MEATFKGFSFLHKQLTDLNNRDINKNEIHGILVMQFELVSKYLIMLRTFSKYKNVIVGGNIYMGWILNQQYAMLKSLPDYIDIFAVQEMHHTPILPLHWPIKKTEEIQQYKDIELFSHLKLLCEYYVQIDHHVKCTPKFPDVFLFERKHFYKATFQFDTVLGYWKLIEMDFFDSIPVDIELLQTNLMILPPSPIPMILVNYDRFLYKQSIDRRFNKMYIDAMKWTKAHQHKLIKINSEHFRILLFPDSTIIQESIPIQIEMQCEYIPQKKSLPIWLAEKLQLREKELEESSSNRRSRRKSKTFPDFHEFYRSTPILKSTISCDAIKTLNSANVLLLWLQSHSKITFTTLSDTLFSLDVNILPFFSIQHAYSEIFHIFNNLSNAILTQNNNNLSESGFDLTSVTTNNTMNDADLILLSQFSVKSKLPCHGFMFDHFKSLVPVSTIYAISTTTLLSVSNDIHILKCVHGQLVHFYQFKPNIIRFAVLESMLNDLQHRLLYYRVPCQRLHHLSSHSNLHCISVHGVDYLEASPQIDHLGIITWHLYTSTNHSNLHLSTQDVAKMIVCYLSLIPYKSAISVNNIPYISYKWEDCVLILRMHYKHNITYPELEWHTSLQHETSVFMQFCADFVSPANFNALVQLIKCTWVLLKILDDWECELECLSLLEWRLRCSGVVVDFIFVLGSNDIIIRGGPQYSKYKLPCELPSLMKHYCAPSITNIHPLAINDVLKTHKQNETELLQCDYSMDDSWESDSSGELREIGPLQMLHNLQGHGIYGVEFSAFFTLLDKCSWKKQFIDGLKQSMQREIQNSKTPLFSFFKQHPELMECPRQHCISVNKSKLFVGPIFVLLFVLQQFKTLLLSEEMIKWIDFDLQVASGIEMQIVQKSNKQRQLELEHFTINAEFDRKGWKLKFSINQQQENVKIEELLKRGQELLCDKLNKTQHQKQMLISIVKLISIVPLISLQMIQLMLTNAKLKNKTNSDVGFEVLLSPVKGLEIPIQVNEQRLHFYFKSTTVEKTLVAKYQYDLQTHKLDYLGVINGNIDENTLNKITKFLTSSKVEEIQEKTKLGRCLFVITSFLHDCE